jgi:hypothetical protein
MPVLARGVIRPRGVTGVIHLYHAAQNGTVLSAGSAAGMAPRKKLRFYDVKAKQPFETDQYEVVEKQTARGPMLFAVATSPHTGIKAWRLLGRKR